MSYILITLYWFSISLSAVYVVETLESGLGKAVAPLIW